MSMGRLLPALLLAAVAALAAPTAALGQTMTTPGQIFGEDRSGAEDPSGDNGSRAGEASRGEGGSGSPQQASPEGSSRPEARWQSPNYGPPLSAGDEQRSAGRLPPFGSNLFEGGFRGTMADGLTPGYEVKPGDQVTVRVWGAVSIDQVLSVDAKGNIFLPRVGPVPVQGLNASQLDAKVRSAINSVYSSNVEVYTNLQGVQPVGVFVSGYVEKPGRYSGTPSDSLLYFLDQAGGIDGSLGSYRRITVRRDGEVIARADLYDFLIGGDIPQPQFRDGDTIVVDQRGPGIAVTGDVKRAYRYELAGEDQPKGQDLLELARLQSGVSHVLLRGSRASGPVAEYLTVEAFAERELHSGDEVEFSQDQRSDTIIVELEGSYKGPSRYALPKDAHLGELLDAVPVPRERAAIESVSIKRESVAERQRQALTDSLRRLEQRYLGASSQTDEGASIQVKEAELIQKFVERAREVEVNGRLVVAQEGGIRDVRLQDGDVITIPEESDAVLLSGEISVPQAVVHKPGLSARDYIEQAGGFTPRAQEDTIWVVRQNGAVREASAVDIRSGDEILVMPKVPTKNLQVAKTITQIMFQIAVSAGTALQL